MYAPPRNEYSDAEVIARFMPWGYAEFDRREGEDAEMARNGEVIPRIKRKRAERRKAVGLTRLQVEMLLEAVAAEGGFSWRDAI